MLINQATKACTEEEKDAWLCSHAADGSELPQPWRWTDEGLWQVVSFASIVGLFCLYRRSLLPQLWRWTDEGLWQVVSFASIVGLFCLYRRSLLPQLWRWTDEGLWQVFVLEERGREREGARERETDLLV